MLPSYCSPTARIFCIFDVSRTPPIPMPLIGVCAPSVQMWSASFEAEALIQSGALQSLVSSLSDREGIVGPQILYLDGRLKAAGGVVEYGKGAYGYGHLDPQPDHPRYKFARQVDFCPTGYLIKKDILDQLAGFNEQYRTFEFAHIDLAFRSRALGHPCDYCPSAQVFSYCAERVRRSAK